MVALIVDTAKPDRVFIIQPTLPMVKALEAGDLDGLVEVKKHLATMAGFESGENLAVRPERVYIIDSSEISGEIL